jgi:hypothetical protein
LVKITYIAIDVDRTNLTILTADARSIAAVLVQKLLALGAP